MRNLIKLKRFTMKKNFILMALIFVSVIATQVACEVNKSRVEKTVQRGLNEKIKEIVANASYPDITATAGIGVTKVSLTKSADNHYVGTAEISADWSTKIYFIDVEAVADSDSARYQWDADVLKNAVATLEVEHRRFAPQLYARRTIDTVVASYLGSNYRPFYGEEANADFWRGLEFQLIESSLVEGWKYHLEDKYGTRWTILNRGDNANVRINDPIYVIPDGVETYDIYNDDPDRAQRTRDYIRAVMHHESGE
jgi:hypothetical protein